VLTLVFILLFVIEHGIGRIILNVYGALMLLTWQVRFIVIRLLKKILHLMLAINGHAILLRLSQRQV